jgi:hypothetical protein
VRGVQASETLAPLIRSLIRPFLLLGWFSMTMIVITVLQAKIFVEHQECDVFSARIALSYHNR